MKPSNDRLSPKQLEDLLGISKVQLHHWERLLDLKPLERSYGRGLATVYSRENLFSLLLLQRLFQQCGFKLPAAVALVKKLLRDVGLGRLLTLSSVTAITFATDTTDLLQPRAKRLGRTALQQTRRSTKRPEIVGSLTIPLKDLQEVFHGPVT